MRTKVAGDYEDGKIPENEYGDELCIRSFADFYEKNVKVISPTQTTTYIGNSLTLESSGYHVITYTPNYHYDATKEKGVENAPLVHDCASDHEVNVPESASSNTGLENRKRGRPRKTDQQKNHGGARIQGGNSQSTFTGEEQNSVCECPLHCTGPRYVFFMVRVCADLDHDMKYAEFIAGDGGLKRIHAHHFSVSEMYVLNNRKYLQPWGVW